MPIFKFSVSDAQLAGFKDAASANLLDVNDWARGHLATIAAQHMAKAPQEKPAKLSAAERKRQERFESTLANVNEKVAKGEVASVGAWVARYMTLSYPTAHDRAVVQEFEAWARAHGHIEGE